MHYRLTDTETGSAVTCHVPDHLVGVSEIRNLVLAEFRAWKANRLHPVSRTQFSNGRGAAVASEPPVLVGPMPQPNLKCFVGNLDSSREGLVVAANQIEAVHIVEGHGQAVNIVQPVSMATPPVTAQ